MRIVLEVLIFAVALALAILVTRAAEAMNLELLLLIAVTPVNLYFLVRECKKLKAAREVGKLQAYLQCTMIGLFAYTVLSCLALIMFYS